MIVNGFAMPHFTRGVAFKRVISFLTDWELFSRWVIIFLCGGGGGGGEVKFPLFAIGSVSG